MPASFDPFATSLPIGAVLGDLGNALAANVRVLLQAPPGAGKTTIAPLALLRAPWLAARRILVLEPRRLAARSAARWMAAQLGEPVGGQVGFRVRMESRVGPTTRIEVVTEGVLTRILQDDPTLEQYGLVIFDEFHERSLQADAGLALTLHSQRLVRPDLRILVMSATLDVAGLSSYLGDPPVVTASGRQYRVETRYFPPPRMPATPGDAAAAARRALAENPGDVLVFLPGVPEIRRCAGLLEAAPLPHDAVVVPLHGMLSPQDQQRAMTPAPSRRPRVVLATSIAETSLTIDGVRTVVDVGLARRPRFSTRTGMTQLHTSRVSRAAADQRRGRAGREAPGVCYRLWHSADEASLLPSSPAEILDADLVPLMLDLANMGIGDPAEIPWLEEPPRASVGYARELLHELEAVDDTNRVTPHGRRLAGFGTHPRLAHMILRSTERGLGALACDVASLLEERDPLRAESRWVGADLRARLDMLRGEGTRGPAGTGTRLDTEALRRMRAQSARWRTLARAEPGAWDRDAAGRVLSLAYPDRVAQRRPGPAPRYVLRNGTGAQLDEGDALHDAPYLVVAATDGRAPQSRIFLAAPVGIDDIETEYGTQFEVDDGEVGVEESGVIRGVRSTRLGAIVFAEVELRHPDPASVGRALARHVERHGIGALPWDDGAERLRHRLRFARQTDPAWPDVTDEALAVAFTGQMMSGATHGALRRLRDVDVSGLLLDLLPPARRAMLDRVAPLRFRAASGREVPIDYSDPGLPVVEVRLQEMFGCIETPVVGTTRIPLTVRLLSPANRPVQVTRDLAGFWRSSYHEVRRELRARYPKHDWPEDPIHAVPTSRPRRR